jgi:hypothetical protein
VRRELYSANDFRDTPAYFRGEEPRETRGGGVDLPAEYSVIITEIRNPGVYNPSAKGGEYVET